MPKYKIPILPKGLKMSLLVFAFCLTGGILPKNADASDIVFVSLTLRDQYGSGINTNTPISGVDIDGNVYMVGEFEGTADFDPGAGVDNRTASGSFDAFVQKYDSLGGYEWVRTIGGAGSSVTFGQPTLDDSGNIFIPGIFTGTIDFNPGVGLDEKTSGGINNPFISKYDSSGNYQWTNAVGIVNNDLVGINSMATDSNGDIYFSGFFNGTVDFDPSGGEDIKTFSLTDQLFLSKYNDDGTYQWTKTFEGSYSSFSLHYAHLQVGNSGDLYMAGSFSGSVDFDPGVGNHTHASVGIGGDAFLSKYDLDGNYQWSKTFGGVTASTSCKSLEIDKDGNILLVGNFFRTTDFNPDAGEDNRTATGDQIDRPDVFISKFDTSGSYQWVKTVGGPGADWTDSSAVDPAGNLYVSGIFRGTADFDPTSHQDFFTAGPQYSVFMTAYDASGNYRWTKVYQGDNAESASVEAAVLMTSKRAWIMYIGGTFSGTVDADLTDGTVTVINDEWTDPNQFLTRYRFNPFEMNYPGPSPTPDTAPTFTFTLPACAGGNLQYRIQIDDNSDFGSPAVDYTSGPKDPGNNFFTVGQPEGTGSYAVGSEGQELPYGTYFWRVSSICNSDPSVPDGGDPITIEPAVSTSFVGTTLDINATISLSCDPSVTMNALVGTGRSTIDENNRADCTVISNNSSGYALSWQASSDDLLNSQSDHFTAYSPAASTTPETWDIPNTTSAWGAKLASTSEGYGGGSGGSGYTYPGTGWGSDDSYASGLWLNVAASEPFQFMQKATETDVDGETQSLMFGAEIGADKIQPTGTYTTNVTVTAVTLSGGGGGGGGGPTPPDGVDGQGYTYYNAVYGDTINGTLDTGDYFDGDYYYEKILFSGTSGDQVTFDASWLSSTGYLLLFDENDNWVDENGDWNIPASGTFGPWTLPTTGVYTLYVTTGDIGEVGPYSVTLNQYVPVACVTHNTVYNQYVNGDLDVTDCTDGPFWSQSYWEKITFSGTLGDQIIITGDFDTSTGYMYLIDDSTSATVWELGDSPAPAHVDSVSAITLPTTGTYTVWVRDYTDSYETSTYSVYISDGE